MTATEAPPVRSAEQRGVSYPMDTPEQRRKAYMRRLNQLEVIRSDWDSHFWDLGRNILPRSPRFRMTDRNRSGQHRYNSIIDNTPTRSAQVLAAGLMSGMTSPARPWFRMTTRDADLRDDFEVRMWLDMVTERMQMVFAKSNLYRVLPTRYEELGVFGTSAMLVLGDFDTVIHCYPLVIGQYYLQQDWQGRIVTCYRTFEKTVGEVVDEFGYENCSNYVQEAWKRGDMEADVKILHVVEPRSDRDRNLNSPASVDMAWTDSYLELTQNATKMLREGGFRRMRVLAPRWQVTGGDVYGISPGMQALGDCQSLQQMQLRKSQAIDYQTMPPLQIPTQLKDRPADTFPQGRSYFEPGDVLPFDQNSPNGGVRTMFDVQLDLGAMLLDIQDTRLRIKQAFYEDLFLMLATRVDNRMTATEVLERQEEKLLMIGPVLERLSNELLEPLIDITFHEMMERGVVPQPPDILVGRELEVEFVSILAQAQQAVGITGVQQWMQDTLIVGQTRPDMLDNVNFDEYVRGTAEMRGVGADHLLAPEDVQALRDARADAQAARDQAEMANVQADTTQKLATAPIDQNSALDAAMDTLAGTPAEG